MSAPLVAEKLRFFNYELDRQDHVRSGDGYEWYDYEIKLVNLRIHILEHGWWDGRWQGQVWFKETGSAFSGSRVLEVIRYTPEDVVRALEKGIMELRAAMNQMGHLPEPELIGATAWERLQEET